MTLTRTKYFEDKEQKVVARKALQDPIPAMRKLVQSSLYYCLRYFWDCYTEDPFQDNWHIRYLASELELVAKRVGERKPKLYDLVINVPPGTTKTALVSIFFPIWCWLNWHWMKFITSSHSSDLSLESSDYSREIIRSQKFRQMFPELDIKEDKDTKSNYRLIKKIQHTKYTVPRIAPGGMRKSTSVGAKIVGFHADIIIPDDLLDPREGISEKKLLDANNHLDQVLSMRKTNKKCSVIIMIAQRLAMDDPPGHMLSKKNKKVKHICLPGEIRSNTKTEEGKVVSYKEFLKPSYLEKFYKDGYLDPVRLGEAELIDIEADLGQYGYAGQVGQNPIPAGGGMFLTNKIHKIYSLEGYDVVKWVRYWDKAGTQGGGAYTAGVKMGITKNNQFIIADMKRDQLGSHERERLITSTAHADTHKVTIGIEQEGGSGGKESAEETIKRLKGYQVIADKPVGDKTLRADPFSVQVNWGNVLILDGEWNDAFTEELKVFPLGKYKDQVDACSGAFAILTGRIKKKGRALGKRWNERKNKKKKAGLKKLVA